MASYKVKTDSNTWTEYFKSYESKSAANGGTALSLVTTGEKYTWDNKQNALPTTTTANQVLKSTSTSGSVQWGTLSASDIGAVDQTSLGQQIILLEDNGSTTDGTWLAKTNQISAYADGQIFLYKVVVAGSTTTKLNITGSGGTALGAKTIYRYGTTKLTTQYGIGQYILLMYNSLNTSFRVVNDYDNDTNTKVRQYQAGTAARTGTQYSILARYALTDKAGTYDANYSRYHTDTYIDTSNGYLYAPKLYSGGNEVAIASNIPTSTSDLTNDSGFITSSDIPQEIFYCTYGITTFAEVTQAIADGKLPVCIYPGEQNHKFVLVWSHFTGANYYYFSCAMPATTYSVYLTQDANWSQLQEEICERVSHKVTSLSALSTDTQYPSAKCVYDAIPTVSVSATGTATDEVSYITINGTEKKLAGGSSVTFIDWS